MKRNLLISIAIALLAALFASQNPDGLDKVSEVLGISDKGTEDSAIMAGYNIHFLGMSKLSTIAAGVIGILIIYGLFLFIGFLMRNLIYL